MPSFRGSHLLLRTQALPGALRPLLTPQQIRTLKDHQVIAFLPACPPAALGRMDWRDHVHLTRRAHLPPPALAPFHADVPLVSARAASFATYVEPD